MHNLSDNSTVIDLIASPETGVLGGGLPNSGIITGDSIDTKGEVRKLHIFLNINYISGNTLTVTIQESSDNSTFTTLNAIAAKTGTTSVEVNLTPTKRYIRARATLGATSTAYVVWTCKGLFYNERYRPSNIA